MMQLHKTKTLDNNCGLMYYIAKTWQLLGVDSVH